MAKLDKFIIDNTTYELVPEIAPLFNPATPYSVGDCVIHDAVLYKFTANHAAGAWTGNDVTAFEVGSELVRLGSGGSGSGLTEDVKVALLACFEKVAWIDEDGQDYYDALYDALYPPAELASISAVYTQSGTVYNNQTLDSLKSDLVVTGHMSDSTLRTITTYTLSGTLSVGTSMITVSYGGKTTTFNVTVTEYVDTKVLVYDWDFTDSLTDKKSSKVAALTGTQDSSGINLTASNHRCVATNVITLGTDCTIEVDLTSYTRKGSDHGRFIMLTGTTGFIYRKTGKWALYLNGAWTESSITNSAFFNGKTVVMKIIFSGTSSMTVSIWCDNEKIVEATETTISKFVSLGSGEANSAYDSIISGLRIYQGV